MSKKSKKKKKLMIEKFRSIKVTNEQHESAVDILINYQDGMEVGERVTSYFHSCSALLEATAVSACKLSISIELKMESCFWIVFMATADTFLEQIRAKLSLFLA